MTALAARTNDTITFHTVELLKEASALTRAGVDVISLGVGEPDFTAAPAVVAASLAICAPTLTQCDALGPTIPHESKHF